jgi:hypothetical protein
MKKTIILAVIAGSVIATGAEKILFKDSKPEIVQALPEVIDPGAVVYEGTFTDIDVSQDRAPLYVVKKLFRSDGGFLGGVAIISLMHTNEHAIATKERYRQNDNVILATLRREEISEMKRIFPDRRIVEVMPDPRDTKIRSGRVGPYVLTKANVK